jgi:hypothetical protein
MKQMFTIGAIRTKSPIYTLCYSEVLLFILTSMPRRLVATTAFIQTAGGRGLDCQLRPNKSPTTLPNANPSEPICTGVRGMTAVDTVRLLSILRQRTF